jgi:hypothetical protein
VLDIDSTLIKHRKTGTYLLCEVDDFAKAEQAAKKIRPLDNAMKVNGLTLSYIYDRKE